MGIVVVVGLTGLLACEREISPPPAPPPTVVDTRRGSESTGVVADTALRYPFVPNTTMTPGAALDVTAADICIPGYSKRVRNVPAAVKRQAYASYGIRTHAPGEYEVDHLISLELGGSNSIRNLWPQSFRTRPWNAYVKDALENELHRRVCAGTIDLAKAQNVIAHNWVIGYRIYVRPEPPPPKSRAHSRNRVRQPPQRPRPQFQSPVP
jgi:hypothetical protein